MDGGPEYGHILIEIDDGRKAMDYNLNCERAPFLETSNLPEASTLREVPSHRTNITLRMAAQSPVLRRTM